MSITPMKETELYQSLRELVGQLERRTGALWDSQMACCDITLAQCHALVEIGRAGTISLVGLSEALGLNSSTLSRTIDHLVSAEMVNREVDPANRRYVVISLTENGQQVFYDIDTCMNTYYKQILQKIPEENHAVVLESIQVLLDALVSKQEQGIGVNMAADTAADTATNTATNTAADTDADADTATDKATDTSADIRETIQERYGKIASDLDKKGDKKDRGNACCSSACGCGNQGITDTSVNYAGMELSALPQKAIEASLGCANPLVFAQLKEGETVLDLGSGGGIDVLMASRFVGSTGIVYGLDMTDEMLRLANDNKAKMGVTNAEFIKGYIEDIPLQNGSVDAVISNCVINLSADKEKVLSEAYRVIKQGGRLRVADVVSLREIDPKFRENAEMWCACLAGTITIEEYESILRKCGYTNIKIEIVHVYTKEIISSEFFSDSKPTVADTALEVLDGAFAGALISADK